MGQKMSCMVENIYQYQFSHIPEQKLYSKGKVPCEVAINQGKAQAMTEIPCAAGLEHPTHTVLIDHAYPMFCRPFQLSKLFSEDDEGNINKKLPKELLLR